MQCSGEYIKCPAQEWTDNNLRWNESEYGDIKDLRIPPAYIWAPDILMYNRSVLRLLRPLRRGYMRLRSNN